MFPFIYIGILASIGLLALAFIIKEWVIGFLAGCLLMVLGIYLASNGMLGIHDLSTDGFGIIMICLGFYVMVRGSMEKFKEGKQ